MSLHRRLKNLEHQTEFNKLELIHIWYTQRYERLLLQVHTQMVGGIEEQDNGEPAYYMVTDDAEGEDKMLHTGIADTYKDAWPVGRKWIDQYHEGTAIPSLEHIPSDLSIELVIPRNCGLVTNPYLKDKGA